MTGPMGAFERETGESRSRLGGPVPERLSVSAFGQSLRGMRPSQIGIAVDNAVKVVKRNPIAALAIAAGAGWLLYTMNREKTQGHVRQRRMNQAEEIPILNTGQARVYDPDASSRYPMQDSLESRREMSARL